MVREEGARLPRLIADYNQLLKIQLLSFTLRLDFLTCGRATYSPMPSSKNLSILLNNLGSARSAISMSGAIREKP